MSNVLIISDLHCPIEHPDAYEFMRELKKVHKPDLVVSVGDECDLHNFSKWLKDPEAPGVEDELDQAIEHLQDWYKLFPNLKVCTSNHTFRYLKRAQEAGLSKRMIKQIRDILDAPKGWVWADRWDIDGVLYSHGEEGNDPYRLIRQYRRNIVVGHAHSKAGVTYSNNGIQTNWCLQTGCLIDLDSYGMRYAKSHLDKAVLGTGLITEGVPYFIPLM